MKWLVSLSLLIVLSLNACNGLNTNTEVTVNGTTYKVVEVKPTETKDKTIEPTKENAKEIAKVENDEMGRENISTTRYYIRMNDGSLYAFNDNYIFITSETLKIKEYNIRKAEGEKWYYHKEELTLNRKDIKRIEQLY